MEVRGKVTLFFRPQPPLPSAGFELEPSLMYTPERSNSPQHRDARLVPAAVPCFLPSPPPSSLPWPDTKRTRTFQATKQTRTFQATTEESLLRAKECLVPPAQKEGQNQTYVSKYVFISPSCGSKRAGSCWWTNETTDRRRSAGRQIQQHQHQQQQQQQQQQKNEEGGRVFRGELAYLHKRI